MCVRSICIHPVPDVTEDEKRAKIQSSNIERDLFEQAKLEVNVIKILLLGKFVCVRGVCVATTVSHIISYYYVWKSETPKYDMLSLVWLLETDGYLMPN